MVIKALGLLSAIARTAFLAFSAPARAQTVGNGPNLIPQPGLSCDVTVGKPHYSGYWDGLGKDAVDTHTYVKCNEDANSLQPVTYLYVEAFLGTTPDWEQMPSGGGTFNNVANATSDQSYDWCTYVESWYYAATGFAYIHGGPAQNASNSYSNVYVLCESKYA